MNRLESIEARLREVSDGPWAAVVINHDVYLGNGEVYCGEIIDVRHGELGEGRESESVKWSLLEDLNIGDARFIAGARQDVPWLIARVRELESKLAASETQGDAWNSRPQ